jgi:CRP/FNR family transcriptional regulator
LCSALAGPAATALSRIAHFRRIPVGQVIQSEQQEPSWFAVIISGVVKLVKAHQDGRHQIVGLQYPADLVGSPYCEKHSLIAEATTNLELCCFSKSAFENLMREHPSLEHALLRRALDDLDASREWMFLLGSMTAREKVASLLASIAGRFARAGCEGEHEPSFLKFNLPLSRIEIADALGLRVETVSREIRYLKASGVIVTAGRRKITVPDLPVLRAVAQADSE